MNSLSITPQLDDSQSLLVRKDALAYGSALYARRAYQPGEVIARFDDAQDAPQSYLTVQIAPQRHVLLDMLGNLNHSCRPNLAIDADARTVTACRAILPGDMLTFFYPSTEWDMARPFSCQCGEPECVGYIAGARYLSTDTLARYRVSPHIVGMIAAALSDLKLAA